MGRAAGPTAAGGRQRRARLVGVELVRVSLPLLKPWASTAGTFSHRDSLLVRAVLRTDGVNGGRYEEIEGWGECAALPGPTFSSEYTAAAADISERYLVPALLRAGAASAAAVSPVLAAVKGHHMAKTAFEMALLDAELRVSGGRMADYFSSLSQSHQPPRATVAAGVAVGLTASVTELTEEVGQFVEEGYARVKLKIAPGWDLAPVSAVRERWPQIVLFVDANGAYQGLPPAEVVALLSPLDDYGLACIEQPLSDEDLRGHAALARHLATPICLDEALTSYDRVVSALDLGACSVVNVKAGRLGGYLEAVRVHDLCARRKVPVWCGGMVETGIARAANIALATLPDFALPGDLSSTGRFFGTDLTSPLRLGPDGTIAVPEGPSSGVTVDHAALAAFATWRRWWPAS